MCLQSKERGGWRGRESGTNAGEKAPMDRQEGEEAGNIVGEPRTWQGHKTASNKHSLRLTRKTRSHLA